jgi:UDP-N-acetylglucosamine--dolichyl-phosphate N-acetylglucosaminephosphotransferase
MNGKIRLIISAALICGLIFLITGRYGSLLGSLFIALIISLIATPYIKKKFEAIGLMAMDVQKKKRPKMATSGGIPVVLGFLSGVFIYIAYTTFISGAPTNLTVIFAGITMMLLMSLLTGLFDDMIIQPEKKTHKGEKDTRIGLRQKDKLFLSIIGVIPLMVVNAGTSIINIPFFGEINFGLLYPLIIIPLIIIFCSNASNMLAGMNGIEAGMGAVLLCTTGIYSLLYGNVEGAIIALVMTGALIGFLYHNKYPAKYLPGDSLTYLIGSSFAASIILGNIEKFAVIAYIPWFIEFFLKARVKFQASSLGILQKDGSLKSKHEKIYSWTHIAMRIVKKEKYITLFMIFIVGAFSALAFIVSRLII